MKHLSSGAAVLAVLVLSAGGAYANAPQLSDVPDIQVLNSAPVDIDLRKYVSDINDKANDLIYAGTRSVDFAGATEISDVLGLGVLIDASYQLTLPVVAPGSADGVIFSAEDSSEAGYDVSEVRGVDVLVTQPSLYSDLRLTPGMTITEVAIAHTYPVYATSAAGPEFNRTVLPVTSAAFGEPVVSGTYLSAATIAKSNWTVKMSRLAIADVVGAPTFAISNRHVLRRVVTDAVTGGDLSNNPQVDDYGNLSVTVGPNGSLTLDPQGPFTAGAIVLGIKGTNDSNLETTKNYVGATVLVPQLLTEHGGSGFVGRPTSYNNNPTSAFPIPMMGTYYFEGISDFGTLLSPTSGQPILLGASGSGQTLWALQNPGAHFTNTSGANASIPRGSVQLVSVADIPANPITGQPMQDDRYAWGDCLKLKVQGTTQTGLAPVGGQTVGRSAKLIVRNLKVQAGKTYGFSYSAYTHVINSGSGNARIFNTVSNEGQYAVASYILKGNAVTVNGDSFPKRGWRKIHMKYTQPDFSYIPAGYGWALKTNAISVNIELNADGPTQSFSGTWNPWNIEMYIDNFEAYEVPGYDIDLALGNTELFGSSRAYPQVPPASRGFVIGDFEGGTNMTLDDTPVPVNVGNPARPADNNLANSMGWIPVVGPDGNNSVHGGASGPDYAGIRATTAENHWTSPYQDANGGRALFLHPGTVNVSGAAENRVGTAIALNGGGATKAQERFNSPAIDPTAPQTFTMRFWIKPPSLYTSNYTKWPRFFVNLVDTNSQFDTLSAAAFAAWHHVAMGSPGMWHMKTVEIDFPAGVAKHLTPSPGPGTGSGLVFNGFPNWNHGPSNNIAPPPSWSDRFVSVVVQAVARRNFDTLSNLGANGLIGNYAAGSLAGRANTSTPMTTGMIYVDDFSFYSSAMDNSLYYDRNYFEQASLPTVNDLP